MTKEEVIDLILKTPKPYLYIDMPQPTFAATIRRIRTGSIKESTEIEFFKKFGYTVQITKSYSITEFNPLKKQ